MSTSIVTLLPLDLTGNAPENHVGAEHQPLVAIPGFDYRIVTLTYGGFYTRDLKVYDADYNKLRAGKDFVFSYVHDKLKKRVGLNICSAIVILNPDLQNEIIVSAQMVGGDVAYSFSVKDDYVAFVRSKPAGYVPENDDYIGVEPIWAPGELEEAMWGLDKYQPFNNELENIKRAITDGNDDTEENFRTDVKKRYEELLAKFDDRLDRHIADKEDPHDVTAFQVGLGAVNNYRVATQIESDQGGQDELYITPALAHETIRVKAVVPFENHTRTPPTNPHQDNFSKIGSNSKAQVDGLLATLYERNEKVVNSETLGIAIPGVFNPGYYDINTIISAARQNQDTSFFTAGKLTPGQLSWGSPSATHILRGDGAWMPIEQITQEFGTPNAPRAIAMGQQTDHGSAINLLNVSFSNLALYPIGSMAFYSLIMYQYHGVGNGASYNGYTMTYAAYRDQAGWRRN